MKKLFFVILLLLLSFSVACRQKDDVPSVADRGICTYLVAGLDETSANTDVLFLLSYNRLEEEVTVLQIPRDTFSRYKNTEGKINRIVPTLLTEGVARNEAMRELSRYIEDNFSIDIDGYVFFDTDGFRRVVDAVGGVDIISEREISITDERGIEQFTVARGKTHLDVKTAETFVRFRRGYVTGDLGRINAQKLFLDAFLRRVKAIGVDSAARLAVTLASEIHTDLSICDVLQLFADNRGALENLNAKYITLPGEAIIVDGTSFYILNRKYTAEILSENFGACSDKFDVNGNFTSNDKQSVKNIYFDEDTKYKYYKD